MIARLLSRGGPVAYLMPLTVFAFSAPAVNYTNYVFTTNTRWLVLAALATVIALRQDIFAIFQSATGTAALAYAGWCVSTVLWSQVPMLSLMKSGSLMVLVVAMFAAGQHWLRLVPLKSAVDYSLPMAGLALFSGLAGQVSIAAQVELGTGVIAFMGLTTNPNMFASILAMGLPVLLWGSYRAWRQGRPFSLWTAGLLAVLGFLIATYSRASMLTAVIILLGFAMAPSTRHRISIAAAGVVAAIVIVVVTPNVDEHAALYFRKGGSSILYSREQVWSESYAMAKAGGVFGAGYGVTAGETSFEVSLTSFGYGREKGNSQLAICEETGLVGLGLYAMFLLTAALSFLRGMRLARDRDTKVMLGIMIGAWGGMTANSVFEAWWVAPGSPEAVWFWSLTGVLAACVERIGREHRHAGAAPASRLRGPAPA
jgi:O-antigen ligase